MREPTVPTSATDFTSRHLCRCHTSIRARSALPITCRPTARQVGARPGEDGACTGFGLGALINYLLFAQSVEKGTAPPGRISTRMLYHLARKYDEWPGEDYEGSSCRGAMKGWFHHGVCEERYWPYLNPKGQPNFVKPVQGWDTDAAKRPVGAYYRITEFIADMQAAINEVGAVYVSSDVHGGWDLGATKKMPLPVISWKPGTKPDGGHAFALVGYDADGFIVQNSWGEGWGYFGFARCSTTTGSRTAMTRGLPSWARRSTPPRHR